MSTSVHSGMLRAVIERIGPAHEMEWRPCPGFPNFEISEWGDLRRVVGCETRQAGDRPRGFIDSDGYLRYALRGPQCGSKVSVQAHRLVAEAFIGPAPTPKHEIAHNNGSRICVHFSELRWALRAENHADMQIHGTSTTRGERNPKSKITAQDVLCIRREYRAIKNHEDRRRVSDLARQYGLHHATIVSIAKGKSWSHIPMEAA